MNRRLSIVAAASFLVAVACGSPGFAQEPTDGAVESTPGGFGLSLNSAVTGNANMVGVGIVFDLGPMRFDPTFALAEETLSVDGTRNDQGDFDALSRTERVYRVGTGIHGVILENARARVWLGGDFAFGALDAGVTESTQDDGIRTDVVDDTVTTFVSVAPVLGGEFNLVSGLAVGLRVGPEFIFGALDVENEPNIDSASLFILNGYARLDLIYYF